MLCKNIIFFFFCERSSSYIFLCCEVSGPFRLGFYYCKKCLPTKQVQSPDDQNAGIFVFLFDTITTVLRAEKLAKGISLVLPMKSHVIFVQTLLKNNKLKSSTDIDMSENKRYWIPAILLKVMIWTYWEMTWRHFLALKQTLRVLLIIYFHLHASNPYILNLCL